MNVSVLNKFRFVAVFTAMTCTFLGNVHPTMAGEKTINNISPEIFACLKSNNVNNKGYVYYGDHDDMWVGKGHPGNPGGIPIHYHYDPSQRTITLRGTGGPDLADVLGQTERGINGTAAKCRSGEFH